MSCAGSFPPSTRPHAAPCTPQHRSWLPAPQRQSPAVIPRPRQSVCNLQLARGSITCRRSGSSLSWQKAACSTSLQAKQPSSRTQREHQPLPLPLPLLATHDALEPASGGVLDVLTYAAAASWSSIASWLIVMTAEGTWLFDTGAGELIAVDPVRQGPRDDLKQGSQGDGNLSEEGSSTSDSSSGSEQSDGTGVASVPLSMPRRSLQLQFTCGKCGAHMQLAKQPVRRLYQFLCSCDINLTQHWHGIVAVRVCDQMQADLHATTTCAVQAGPRSA